MQVFLGFVNFYRPFIYNLSKIAEPMSDMLKGGMNGEFTAAFRPTTKILLAFKQLQEAFTKAPVPIHFDASILIQLETDTSRFAIAGFYLSRQNPAGSHLMDRWKQESGRPLPLIGLLLPFGPEA
jgi:hypothetical protein